MARGLTTIATYIPPSGFTVKRGKKYLHTYFLRLKAVKPREKEIEREREKKIDREKEERERKRTYHVLTRGKNKYERCTRIDPVNGTR